MSFIIHQDYHIIDNKRTLKGAKASLTRKWAAKYPKASIMESELFFQTEPIVIVKSLINGQDVELRKSQVGGCCDPSTERYWSM